jgi:hypothetical protein
MRYLCNKCGKEIPEDEYRNKGITRDCYGLCYSCSVNTHMYKVEEKTTE